MARKMIEQERLRGRPPGRRLIWFESNAEENDTQGNADGLGDVDDTGAPFTMRWDNQIQLTAANVRALCLPLPASAQSPSG